MINARESYMICKNRSCSYSKKMNNPRSYGLADVVEYACKWIFESLAKYLAGTLYLYKEKNYNDQCQRELHDLQEQIWQLKQKMNNPRSYGLADVVEYACKWISERLAKYLDGTFGHKLLE